MLILADDQYASLWRLGEDDREVRQFQLIEIVNDPSVRDLHLLHR
ncbi:MAG: hypothetical protein QF583_02945 [Rhodospirillales bacterium]|nr:hypothetical protein [Rhodospirillales bacterium]